MISYLRGKIKYIGSNWLILDVNGIGYKISSCNTKYVVCSIGENKEFYTHHHIREDRQELYGFQTIEELQMFEILLGVNGVGPKMGMNILGQVGVKKLQQAIVNGDSGIFIAISGVGKKIAAKIIIELKNKLGGLEDLDLGDVMSGSNEIVDALSSLGYNRDEISVWLNKVPSSLEDTESKVKWILKEMK